MERQPSQVTCCKVDAILIWFILSISNFTCSTTKAQQQATPSIDPQSVVVLQTTAGWRKAPALAQRVCIRGLASPSSISLKNTMNTKDLEWFGPPERNTLHPLCVVFPRERVRESLCVCVFGQSPPSTASAPPFISQRGVRTWLLGPRQVGPTM